MDWGKGFRLLGRLYGMKPWEIRRLSLGQWAIYVLGTIEDAKAGQQQSFSGRRPSQYDLSGPGPVSGLEL